MADKEEEIAALEAKLAELKGEEKEEEKKPKKKKKKLAGKDGLIISILQKKLKKGKKE